MSVRIDFHGLCLELLSCKAAHLPSERTLLVADLHLGKDATFRARGIPVPCGPTDSSLASLSAVVAATRTERLILLGDVFHGRESDSPEERSSFVSFRERHRSVELDLILGNHDRWVRCEQLCDRVHTCIRMGGVMLTHDPAEAVGPTIAGHLHPAHRLSTGRHRSQTLPCFWWHEERLVLPAFGEFTGSRVVDAIAGDRIFVVAGSSVHEIPVTPS